MAESVRLPVLGLLSDALRDVFGNLAGLARIAWPYYLLAAVGGALGFVLTGGSAVAETASALLGPGTASILTWLALLACTVKWQRHVILAEPLAGIAALDGRVARYLLWSVLITLLGALPIAAALLLALALGLMGWDAGAVVPVQIGVPGALLALAGVLIGSWVFFRLLFVLPAVSVDDRSVRVRRSWRLTGGHVVRLSTALLLLGLGLALLAAVTGLLQAALAAASSSSGGGQAAAWASEFVLQAVLDLVSTVAGASLIARAYGLVAINRG